MCIFHGMVLIDLAKANEELSWLRRSYVAIWDIDARSRTYVMWLNLPWILVETLGIQANIIIILIILRSMALFGTTLL